MKSFLYCAAFLLIVSCGKDDDRQTPKLNLKASLTGSGAIPLSRSNGYEFFVRNEELIMLSTSGAHYYDFVSSPKLYKIAGLHPSEITSIYDVSMNARAANNFIVTNKWAVFSYIYDELYVLDMDSDIPTNSTHTINTGNHKVEYMTLTRDLPVIALNEVGTGRLSVCLLSADGQSLDTIYTQAATSQYLPKLKLAKAYDDGGEQTLALLIDNGYFNERVREKTLVGIDVAPASVSFAHHFEVDDDVFILEQEGIVRTDELFFFAGKDIYSINLQQGQAQKHEVNIRPSFFFRQQFIPVDDHRVLFKSENGLAAFDLESGSIDWHRQFTNTHFLKSPIVYKDYILLTMTKELSYYYYIGALDANTGEYLGSIIHNNDDRELSFNTSPMVVDEHLYLASDESFFQYALSPAQ